MYILLLIEYILHPIQGQIDVRSECKNQWALHYIAISTHGKWAI